MNRNRLFAVVGVVALLILAGVVVTTLQRAGSPTPESTSMSSDDFDDDHDGIPNEVDQCPFQFATGNGCPATTVPLSTPTETPIPSATLALVRTTQVALDPTRLSGTIVTVPTVEDGGVTPTQVVNVPVGGQDELGSGMERAYAPYSLEQGEVGVVRLELELYPIALTPTFKPPLNPTQTLAPDVTRPPTSTPLPLVASSELQIRTVMQARLRGVDADKFDVVDMEPMNGIRAPEQGSVSWWEWHIKPNANARDGGIYALEVIVFFTTKTDAGVIETTRGERLTFNIQVPATPSFTPKQPTTPNTAPWLPILAVVGLFVLVGGLVIWRQRSQSAGSVASFLPRLMSSQPAVPFAQVMCFVSYSRRDEEFVIRFTQRLHAEGVNVWRDREDIPAGASWDDEIDAALQRCTHVLFVASTSSVKSDNVGDELGAAINYNKRIVPILLEDCQLPFRIRRNQWVDFRGDFESAITKLLKDLGKGAK